MPASPPPTNNSLLQPTPWSAPAATGVHRDRQGGAAADRPVLEQVPDQLRPGDTLVMWRWTASAAPAPPGRHHHQPRRPRRWLSQPAGGDRHHHPGPFQQGSGLLVIHGQFLDTKLHHPALGAQQRHRQRWRGTEAISSCASAGSLAASSATRSRDCWLPSSSTWSRTKATGWVMAAIAAASRGTMSTIEAPRPGQPANDPGVDRLDLIATYRSTAAQDHCRAGRQRPRPPGAARVRPTGPAGLSCHSRPGDHRPPAPQPRRATDPPAGPGPRSPAGPAAGAAWTPPTPTTTHPRTAGGASASQHAP